MSYTISSDPRSQVVRSSSALSSVKRPSNKLKSKLPKANKTNTVRNYIREKQNTTHTNLRRYQSASLRQQQGGWGLFGTRPLKDCWLKKGLKRHRGTHLEGQTRTFSGGDLV